MVFKDHEFCKAVYLKCKFELSPEGAFPGDSFPAAVPTIQMSVMAQLIELVKEEEKYHIWEKGKEGISQILSIQPPKFSHPSPVPLLFAMTVFTCSKRLLLGPAQQAKQNRQTLQHFGEPVVHIC